MVYAAFKPGISPAYSVQVSYRAPGKRACSGQWQRWQGVHTVITRRALQIHAGMGYSYGLSIERYFRDAKIADVYEGTSEIQRVVIARRELGLR